MIDSSDQLQTLNPYVSRETIKKLSDYRDSIISAKFNLVSQKDKEHIWIRHFHDSLRLIKFFEKDEKKIKILDIGSGAGLPGLPLSMVLDNDLFELVLCESNSKKANFIRDCCDQLDILNVQIINDRVENIKNHSFDYIISRATAKINEIFSISYHLTKNSTVYLLHKGVHVVDEINLTTKCWKFDYNIHKNNLEKGSNIFEAKNIIKSIT
ncbi:MAG: 16S rRNA (guanine(527)-N(7))-methyltransferase RsmG [Candidatus Pelagibacterales bacterium]